MTLTPHKKHFQKVFPSNAPLFYPLLNLVDYSDEQRVLLNLNFVRGVSEAWL